MVMRLATFNDGNAHLDESKVWFEDQPDADPELQVAQSIVRGRLITRFDEAVVEAWDAEDVDIGPPQMVRTITGMLMASFRYAKKYSEEASEQNSYPQMLHDMAIDLLDQVLDGTIALGDSLDDVTSRIEESDFYPNDKTAINNPAKAWGAGEDRKFTMDDLFQSQKKLLDSGTVD